MPGSTCRQGEKREEQAGDLTACAILLGVGSWEGKPVKLASGCMLLWDKAGREVSAG